MENVDFKLTKKQEQAVESVHFKTLVLAAPGSGKTTILIERAVWLFKEFSVSPSEIMMCTFSKRAAEDIRNRMISKIGRWQVAKMSIGTIHSIGIDQISRFKEMLGYRNRDKMTIYSEYEIECLLKTIADEFGYRKKGKWLIQKSEVYKAIERSVEVAFCPITKEEVLAHEFMTRCIKHNAVTYDMIVTLFHKLIPKVHGFLKWKHLLIDECQDLDSAQWALFLAHQEYSKSRLYCVGDIDQSVYAWRGATPEYLITTGSKFNVFIVPDNFRSDANIVEFANRVIQNNKMRALIDVKPIKPRKRDVEVVNAYGPENLGIEHIVSLLNDKDVSPSDMVILARTNTILERIKHELDVRGVPTFFPNDKHDPAWWKFLAYMKLTINPHDDNSFLILKDDLLISPEDLLSVRKISFDKQCPLVVAYAERGDDFFTSRYSFDSKISIIFNRLESSGHDFQRIHEFLHEYISYFYDEDSFLKFASTYQENDALNHEGLLHLSTIHGAKGLEWGTVVLAGCNDGIIPLRRGEIEEERRLFYVACTRAIDRLVLIVNDDMAGSRFLAEGYGYA